MAKRHTQTATLEGFSLQAGYDLEAVQAALSAPVVAVDIETDTRWPGEGKGPERDYGLSYAADTILIAFAWRSNKQSAGIRTTVAVGPFDEQFRRLLTEAFQHQSTTFVAHNAVFDMRGLSRLTGGITPANVWCTQTMARLLHPQLSDRLGYGLVAVAEALGMHDLVTQEQLSMKAQRADLHSQDPLLVKQYAADDAQLALSLYEAQNKLVSSDNYGLVELECQAVAQYARMAAVGVRVNMAYLDQRIYELQELVSKALDELKADGLANPNSSKARVRYIYETKHVPWPTYEPGSPFFTTGAHMRLAQDGQEITINDLSTSAAVMRYLVGVAAEMEVDLDGDNDPDLGMLEEQGRYVDQLKALAQYLTASKMLGTLEALKDHALVDGRIHSLVSISTHAGRRSASHPQVQNWRMSSGSDDPTGNMCGIVTGDDADSTLVEIDYSNAENWIAALLSGDNNLAAACASADFHSAMAEQYFSQAWSQADKAGRKQLRKMGKSVTFGTAYGMGPGKLAQRLGVSLDEAKRILDAKDRAFPDVVEAKQAVEAKVQRSGFVTLWTGRRVEVRPEQSYRGWNYCCQGGVSELIKRSVVLIGQAYEDQGLKSRIALDMHDALIISVRHDEWSEAISIASTVMAGVMPQDYNERTSPAIRWIAEPEFDESEPGRNQNKWGKGQLHPLPQPEVKPAPTPRPEDMPAKVDQVDTLIGLTELYSTMQTLSGKLVQLITDNQNDQELVKPSLGILNAFIEMSKFCEEKGIA